MVFFLVGIELKTRGSRCFLIIARIVVMLELLCTIIVCNVKSDKTRGTKRSGRPTNYR